MASLQDWVYGIRDQYVGRVADVLGLNVPGSITVKVVPHILDTHGNEQPAFTKGTVITVSRTYFNSHKTDKGAVVHELAHAVLGDGFQAPTWVDEGIGDYVRDKLGLGESGTASGDHPKQGYQEGAAFMQWLQKIDPGFVKTIVQAGASGQLQPDTLNSYVKEYKSGVTPQQVIAAANGQSGGGNQGSGQGGVAPTLPPTFHLLPGIGGGGGPATGPGQGGISGPGTGGGTAGRPPMPPDSTLPPGNYHYEWKDGAWTAVKGGSGGGDGSKAAAEKLRQENFEATAHTLLTAWQIPLDSEVQDLIQRAAQNGWNTDRFQQHLYQTEAFQQEFPGIFANNGTLKMTPEQYLQNKQAYQDIGSSTGIDVGQGKIAYLFNHNVSPQEFQDRSTSFQRLRDNPQLLNALNQQRKVDGLEPIGQNELFKGLMGEGNKEFYQGWQSAVTRYQAEQAGIKIAKLGNEHPQAYGTVTNKLLNRVNDKGLSEDQLRTDFATLANQLLTTLPASRIQHYGLSKGQIEHAVFGGKNQAELQIKIQHILDQEKAANDNTLAASNSYVGQGGRLGVQGGGSNRGATE